MFYGTADGSVNVKHAPHQIIHSSCNLIQPRQRGHFTNTPCPPSHWSRPYRKALTVRRIIFSPTHIQARRAPPRVLGLVNSFYLLASRRFLANHSAEHRTVLADQNDTQPTVTTSQPFAQTDFLQTHKAPRINQSELVFVGIRVGKKT